MRLRSSFGSDYCSNQALNIGIVGDSSRGRPADLRQLLMWWLGLKVPELLVTLLESN